VTGKSLEYQTMHTHDLSQWQHSHVFAQDQIKAGERRTLVIAMITALMMVVETIAGLTYGSMALLADGLHTGKSGSGRREDTSSS
jgi:Co/Zn/Cd efflux system component